MAEKKCPKCQGYGWWPMGLLSPIGPMDAREYGDRVIQCPWCGQPPLGIKTGNRHQSLKIAKEKEEGEQDED